MIVRETRLEVQFALILAIASCELAGDFLLKTYTDDETITYPWVFLVSGLGIYTLIGGLYAIVLFFGELTIANALWQSISLLSSTLIGSLYFKERLTVCSWIGIVMVGIGALLVGLGEIL